MRPNHAVTLHPPDATARGKVEVGTHVARRVHRMVVGLERLLRHGVLLRCGRGLRASLPHVAFDLLYESERQATFSEIVVHRGQRVTADVQAWLPVRLHLEPRLKVLDTVRDALPRGHR